MEKPQTESLTGDLPDSALVAMPAQRLTGGWRDFVRRNRNAIGALIMFLIFWGILIAFTEGVFLNPVAYTSIFTTLPITIFLVVAIIFTTTNGAIDLSFVSSIGLGAFGFAYIINRASNPENLEAWFISPAAGPWGVCLSRWRLAPWSVS